uniref:Transmembrane protein n=1 Tax=Porolithon onkodes TaxID=231751 RepID=A0A2Z2KS98_9FLOR|nr:hypothetical protein [Porolithon onkodes]ASB29768.1 hypothetical protein [Porolithon onkodes]
MNFIQSSILYNYLYSPKNWLHDQSTITKVFTVFCSLICLPYVAIDIIIAIVLFFLCLYKLIKVPDPMNKNIKKVALIFLFFTIINIQNESTLTISLLTERQYIRICPLDNFIQPFPKYLISLSFIRLLSIHFISLTVIKLLLMTTLYENILLLFFNYLHKKSNQIYQKVFFEINITIEFIQVIFKQLEIIEYSYILRFLEFNKNISSKVLLTIYFLCIKQLILNIKKQIQIISETLYSRNIS